MRQKRDLTLIVLGIISLFLISSCAGGGEIIGGAPTTPFLGGTQGLVIGFLEGSPPEEVTDGDTFDFQALISIRNMGEFDLKKGQVNVSLIGIDPIDFNTNAEKLQDMHPEDDPTPRQRDSEGNIIESVETFVTAPSDTEFFNFKGDLSGNTAFIFRADVCYKYATDVVSEICVLESMIDVANDAICDPSESKSIFSSGSPVRVTSFRQNVVGTDKIQFSFDVVHSGSGDIFLEDHEFPNCPKSPSQRRGKEDKVNVTVKTGLPDVDGVPETGSSLNCVSLTDSTSESLSKGSVKLVNGKRTITCTQTLQGSRTDFKKTVDIDLDFNYLDKADRAVLVKHLIS